MPSELQQNRYDQLIRRVGGIVGAGSKVSEALTELFPVIEVEDIPNELMLLAGTGIAFSGVGLDAGVAETPKAQLFNPVLSGMIVTVTRVDMTSGVPTSVIRYGIEAVTRGVPLLNAQFRDSRPGVAGVPTGVIYWELTAGLSLHTGRLRLEADLPFTMENEKGLFVLAPGTGVTFNAETLDSRFDISFFWRERVAEQSELNF